MAGKPTVSIAATFTAEPLGDLLSFWFSELSLDVHIRIAPPNQLVQQLSDPADLNVILLRLEDWPVDSRNRNIEELTTQFEVASRATVPVLVYLCPSRSSNGSDNLVLDRVGGLPGITLTRLLPSQESHDVIRDELAGIPYTQTFFVELATHIARQVYSSFGAQRKVLVLDCDNTLWTGVCGEDPEDEIHIDTGRRQFQESILSRIAQGLLLCVCSKNNEDDVRKVFERPDMVLRWEHVVAVRVNWSAKSENIRSLARELQLGLDSLVFVDDNAVECAEVRAALPEVLTLQLPSDPSKLASWMSNIWPLDRVKTTAEDANRTQWYREEGDRRRFAERLDFKDFVSRLELRVNVERMEPQHIARAAQLYQRVNQFTCTGVKRSQSEVAALMATHECFVVSVQDRFGDYGLAGVVSAVARESTLVVDAFLLSCRVLGRGVEAAVLRSLAAFAEQRGLSSIAIAFTPTGRNLPAESFLRSLPGVRCDDSGIAFEIAVTHAATLKPVRSGAAEPLAELNTATQTRQSESERWQRVIELLEDRQKLNAAIGKHNRPVRSHNSTDSTRPRNATEVAVADLWARILDISRPGVLENFFDLGGNSLLAVRLVAHVRDELCADFSIGDLFEEPTVAGMAQQITVRNAAADNDDNADAADMLALVQNMSEEEALRYLQHQVSSVRESDSGMDVLAIMTCSRPEALGRALSSYIRNAKDFGHDTAFMVVDDSPSDREREANAAVIENANRLFGADVHHIGAAEKASLRAQLIRDGAAAPGIVDFALFDPERCGHSYGANRNALHLFTTGQHVFSADDDTLCQTTTLDSATNNLKVEFERDPFEYWFVDAAETVLPAVNTKRSDLLGEHQKFLGKFFDEANGEVGATFNGLSGDCGWGSPFGNWAGPMGFLLLDGESHRRLCASEQNYRSASRQVFRAVRQPVIGDMTFFMTTFMGFDNRRLLPPFFPIRRGQDRVFRAILKKCFPELLAACLPSTLGHEPTRPRRFSPGEMFRSASSYDTARLMIDCVQYSNVAADLDAAGRLRALGRGLIELAQQSTKDFAEVILEYARRTAANFIHTLSSRLESANAEPEFWANDVKRYIDDLERAAARPDFWVPLDLMETAAGRDIRVLSQRLVLLFGELLVHWPDMVEASANFVARRTAFATQLAK